jgi:diacylglycerol kinase
VRKYIKGRKDSFGYAFKGLGAMLKHEPNVLLHLVAAFLVIVAGAYFSVSKTEWMFIIAAIALVWITEALNTALEALVDLVSPEYHPLAGRAKDTAAAAVLIAAFFALTVACIIFIPRIISPGL